MDITKLSITSAKNLLKSRQITAVELTSEYIKRIKSVDGKTGAYITVCEQSALEQAKNAQKLIDDGSDLPLCGIPVSIKDNICTKEVKTTCGSKMLADFIPPYSSTVVEKITSLGGVILGKTNMDEFGMGSSTETSYFKITKNPYDFNRVPGGSSGGSAVSVAASLALGSFGSDTGGSIRQPSAFCGVVGLKPTYGMVSRFGLIAFASSLDQIGPIAKTVEDSAMLLEAIAGHDPKDGTSLSSPVKALAQYSNGTVKGLRVGIPTQYLSSGLDSCIRDAVNKSAKELEHIGAVVEQFSMPCLEHVVPAYYLISSAEASSNLSRYDGIKYGHRAENCTSHRELIGKSRDEGFGREVKRRILLGTYALASGYYDEYYKKALKLRTLIQRGFMDAFNKYDVVMSPTTPTTAYKLGENINNPLTMYLADIYTVAANIAGLPAISVPCGHDKIGLPMGISFTGKPFGEPDIIRAASAIEISCKNILKSPQM